MPKSTIEAALKMEVCPRFDLLVIDHNPYRVHVWKDTTLYFYFFSPHIKYQRSSVVDTLNLEPFGDSWPLVTGAQSGIDV